MQKPKTSEKKSWYIWLSLIAFMTLWSRASVQIASMKKRGRAGMHFDRLWMGALGKMFSGFFIVIVPSLIITNLFVPLFYPFLGGHLRDVQGIFGLVSVYFTGVYAAHRFDSWAKKNLFSDSGL